MTREQILARLGELAGFISELRGDPDHVPTLAKLTIERAELRDRLVAVTPVSRTELELALAGLKAHLKNFHPDGSIITDLSFGEQSQAGTVTAGLSSESNVAQQSSDPHSSITWITQRISFLEERIRKLD
jgi:hypothetical protein